MKNKVLLVLLLLPIFLHGQVRHDFKIDLLQVPRQAVIVNYEICPNDHFGFEFGLGHRWWKNTIYVNPEYQYFRQGNAVVTLAARLYPSKKAKADRFYLGAYLWEEFKVWDESGYAEAYQNATGFAPRKRKNVRTGLGGITGFKRAYNNRFVIDFGLGFDIDLPELVGFYGDSVLSFGITIEGKVGYRLGKERVVVPE